MLSSPHSLAERLLLASTLMFPATASGALESPWVNTDKAEVRLLAAGPTRGDTKVLRGGIEIRMARGWYTYWRYPGDAGIPPRFDWAGSGNIASIEVLWPGPQRIAVDAGLESIGYRNEAVFPLHIRAKDPSRPVSLRLKLDFGVCEKICIPAEAKLALDIPPGLSAEQSALQSAEARIPISVPIGETQNGLAVMTAKLDRGEKPRALIEIAVPPGKPFDLFAEGPSEEWALPLPQRLKTEAGRAHFAIALDGAPAGSSPIPSRLRLTLVAGNRAIEVVTPLD